MTVTVDNVAQEVLLKDILIFTTATDRIPPGGFQTGRRNTESQVLEVHRTAPLP